MKKLLSLVTVLLLSVLTVSAQSLSIGDFRTNYVLVAINLLTAVLVVVISVGLFKFVNITRKNKAFVMAYFLIALLLLSSVINVFYFFSGSEQAYLVVYMIDRTVIFIILLVLFIGYKKFRKILSSKV